MYVLVRRINVVLGAVQKIQKSILSKKGSVSACYIFTSFRTRELSIKSASWMNKIVGSQFGKSKVKESKGKNNVKTIVFCLILESDFKIWSVCNQHLR